jgi:hypothetical protein
MERARAAGKVFSLNAGSAEFIADQCRSLGGLPTAIESAASDLMTGDPRAWPAKVWDRLRLAAGDTGNPASSAVSVPSTHIEGGLAKFTEKVTVAGQHAKSTLEHYAEAAETELTSAASKLMDMIARNTKPPSTGGSGDGNDKS